MSRYKSYPKYKNSGIEWIGPVPRGWGITKIKYVVALNPSKTEIQGLSPSTQVTFLPMELLGTDGTIKADQTRAISEVGTGYTYFREGDVSIAKITPCFENGKGAVMRGLQHGLGFGTTELIVARPNDDLVSSDYLHLIFSSTVFRRPGEAYMTGSAGQKRIPEDFVRDFPVGLPSITEQQSVVCAVGHTSLLIDALIAKKTRFIELLREKRQALITHAVTKGLDPTVPMRDSGVEWMGKCQNTGRLPSSSIYREL